MAEPSVAFPAAAVPTTTILRMRLSQGLAMGRTAAAATVVLLNPSLPVFPPFVRQLALQSAVSH